MNDLPAADRAPEDDRPEDPTLFAWLDFATRYNLPETAAADDGRELDLFKIFVAGYRVGVTTTRAELR